MELSNLSCENIFTSTLIKHFGLSDYKDIMSSFKRVIITEDADFQKKFNRLYVIRRNDSWREIYYSYFEEIKNEKIEFKDLFLELSKRVNRKEPSFASKMLATINPNKPIWDSKVKSFFCIKENNDENYIISEYERIEETMTKYIQSDGFKANVHYFDSKLADYSNLTDMKKLDYMIWAR